MTNAIIATRECSEKVDWVCGTSESTLLYDQSFLKSHMVNSSKEHPFQHSTNDKGFNSGYARSKKRISAYGVEDNHDRVNSRLAVPGLGRMALSMLLGWKLLES